jgi:uncharacterized membrane protein
MSALILGLLLFFATHSARIFAEDTRARLIARHGLAKWKLAYSLVSAVGFALIVWGYGQARLEPVPLWVPPLWTRHLASLLTLPAFVLVAAAYVPGTLMKAKLGHPMVAGVKLWALAHLIANGTLADLLLFGSFLVWAIADFASARRRDRAARLVPPKGAIGRDAVAVAVGLVAWFAFARYLHLWLFGVAPFG